MNGAVTIGRHGELACLGLREVSKHDLMMGGGYLYYSGLVFTLPMGIPKQDLLLINNSDQTVSAEEKEGNVTQSDAVTERWFAQSL